MITTLSGFKMYLGASLLSLAGLLLFTSIAHEGMYSGLHFLATAKISVAVISNLAIAILASFTKAFLHIFVGSLRETEIEQLYHSGRGFLMDTVLFLVLSNPTIDGEEVLTYRLLHFIVVLLSLKFLHLILQLRVSHVFESGYPNSRNIFRIAMLGFVTLIADLICAKLFYKKTNKTSSLYLWLLFESFCMLISSLSSIAKLSINFLDLQLEGAWTSKTPCIFFLEMLTDLFSLATFLTFIALFTATYSGRLPIHMTSDVMLTIRPLYFKLKSFQRYRQIVKDLETRFPKASWAELEDADTCIICRDILCEGSRKLPCGHVFHVACLKAWFIQQQLCPTCRTDCYTTEISENNQVNHVEKAISENLPTSQESTTLDNSELTLRKSNKEKNDWQSSSQLHAEPVLAEENSEFSPERTLIKRQSEINEMSYLGQFGNYLFPSLMALDSELEDARVLGRDFSKSDSYKSVNAGIWETAFRKLGTGLSFGRNKNKKRGKKSIRTRNVGCSMCSSKKNLVKKLESDAKMALKMSKIFERQAVYWYNKRYRNSAKVKNGKVDSLAELMLREDPENFLEQD